jgi:hypothetical protein
MSTTTTASTIAGQLLSEACTEKEHHTSTVFVIGVHRQSMKN